MMTKLEIREWFEQDERDKVRMELMSAEFDIPAWPLPAEQIREIVTYFNNQKKEVLA